MNSVTFETKDMILDISQVSYCKDDKWQDRPCLKVTLHNGLQLRIWGMEKGQEFKEKYRLFLLMKSNNMFRVPTLIQEAV